MHARSSVFALALALAPLFGCGSDVEDGESGTGGGGFGGREGEGGGAETGGGNDGAGAGDSCPSALDCNCIGGAFTENECGGFDCHCPQTCTGDEDCPEGFCYQPGGTCGSSSGYCTEPGDASACTEGQPVCGCDGQLYDSACVAAANQVSPSTAPTNDCDAERVPCSDDPDSAACYLETEFCESFGQEPPQCRGLDTNSGKACDELTCECVAPIYSAENCTCSVNDAGFVHVQCGGF